MSNGRANVTNGMLDDMDRVFGLENDPTQNDVEDDNQEADDSQDANTDQDDAGQEAPVETDEQQFDEDGNPLEGLAPAMGEKPARGPNKEVLDKDGKVIAATKQEREQLYNYNRLRIVADDLQRKVQQRDLKLASVTKELADAKFVYGEAPRKLNLNNDQVLEAMQFRAMAENNPVQAVREIVARVLQNGYTMEQLFGTTEATGFINTKAIEQQLDRRLGPITQRLEQETKQARAHEDAVERLTAFVDEHEYADVHGEAIATLVQDRGIAPEKAYYALREFAIKNGFDFTKPLKAQVEAAASAKSAPPAKQPVRNSPGNPRPAGNNVAPYKRSMEITPSTNYRDIIRNTMRENN